MRDVRRLAMRQNATHMAQIFRRILFSNMNGPSNFTSIENASSFWPPLDWSALPTALVIVSCFPGIAIFIGNAIACFFFVSEKCIVSLQYFATGAVLSAIAGAVLPSLIHSSLEDEVFYIVVTVVVAIIATSMCSSPLDWDQENDRSSEGSQGRRRADTGDTDPNLNLSYCSEIPTYDSNDVFANRLSLVGRALILRTQMTTMVSDPGGRCVEPQSSRRPWLWIASFVLHSGLCGLLIGFAFLYGAVSGCIIAAAAAAYLAFFGVVVGVVMRSIGWKRISFLCCVLPVISVVVGSWAGWFAAQTASVLLPFSFNCILAFLVSSLIYTVMLELIFETFESPMHEHRTVFFCLLMGYFAVVVANWIASDALTITSSS